MSRTNTKWYKHELKVKITDDLVQYELKKPDTYCESIKFVNVAGCLVVTGDFGNWIFCREFYATPKGQVSDGYWDEKLQIASTQIPNEYDEDGTKKEIMEKLENLEDLYDDIGDREEYRSYLEDCLDVVYDQIDYEHQAYRNMPSFLDYEDVIYNKKRKIQLSVVYDAFEEICRRMKEDK
jgi:hypothetical protein